MWSTIKELLQKNKNASIIVIENEKPIFVVLNFQEYQRLFSQKNTNYSADEQLVKEEKVIEEVNREIINLQTSDEQSVEVIKEEPREITIEDIPVL